MFATRPTLSGPRHAISAGHYLASTAGMAVLEAGGNAVDAGCAAGIALPGEVRVSLREGEVRARRVVAWETANSLLSWALDRRDLGDDSKVLEPLVEKVLDGCSALPYVGE